MEEQKLSEKTEEKVEEKVEEKADLIPEGVSAAELLIYEEMMKTGLMYGHKKSKTDPHFRKFILTTRNGIEIIDLEETLKAIESAAEFLRSKIAEKATVLLAATQPAAREAIDNLASQFNFPRINERWIGGLLTNFKVLSQRIAYYKKIQSDFEKGGFDKYTKKERVMVNRDIGRMRKIFHGLENMDKVPDAVFIIDPSVKGHRTALREARRLKIPVVAILDSDDNPELIDYPIPANDHAKMAIEWTINRIVDRLKTTDYSKEENNQ